MKAATAHDRLARFAVSSVEILVLLLLVGAPLHAQQDEAVFGGPTAQLRGRLDADFLWASQDPQDRADFGDLTNAVGLRRARAGVFGDLSEDLRYLVEIDLASGLVVLRDAYLAGGDVKETGEVLVGHFREPFSLEGGTSANSFAFMERSPANVLDPARNWGAMYRFNGPGQRWTAAAGVFQSGTDSSDVQFDPGSTTNITVKGTILPIADDTDTMLMHFGAVFSTRFANQSLIVINQRPQSPLLSFSDSTNSPFVPTLSFTAASAQLANLQWAGAYGSLWGQAEWYGAYIDQTGGGPVFLHGSHADVGCFLTGEHRGYLRDSGVFGAVKVLRPVFADFSSSKEERDRGCGAWELTFRYARLDFASANLPVGTTGVDLDQYTVGVNWYLADRMRLMFNYSLALPDLVGTGTSVASVFGMRLGMFW